MPRRSSISLREATGSVALSIALALDSIRLLRSRKVFLSSSSCRENSSTGVTASDLESDLDADDASCASTGRWTDGASSTSASAAGPTNDALDHRNDCLDIDISLNERMLRHLHLW